MKLLEERILKDGKILADGVLNVDSFLHQTIDPELLSSCGEEWKRLFADSGVTKILTIESTGIAIAAIAALHLNVPMIYARKTTASFSKKEYSSAKAISFTHGHEYNVSVPKNSILKGDRILILDDWLANASAMKALIKLTEDCGAEVVGCGVAIEKVYKGGGNSIRNAGYRVESLAMISSISDKEISFC